MKPRPLITASLMLAFSALLLNLSTEKASAQDIHGRLSGTVTDTQGHTIPDADVTIVNESTGVALSLKTNSDGFYVGKELAVGPYRVEVTKDQFKVTIVKGIMVHAGERHTDDVQLELGGKTAAVTVVEAGVNYSPVRIIGIQNIKTADSSPVVSATLSPALSPAKVGSAVKVHMVVENTSDHEIHYGTPLIAFDVRDENGKLPPETPLGCTLHFFSPCHDDRQLSSMVGILVPHKKLEEDEDLTLDYDLSHPGTYTVVGYVRYFSDGAAEYFRTNTIKITVP